MTQIDSNEPGARPSWTDRAMVIVLMAFAGLSALDLALDSPRLWRADTLSLRSAMVTALAGASTSGRGRARPSNRCRECGPSWMLAGRKGTSGRNELRAP